MDSEINNTYMGRTARERLRNIQLGDLGVVAGEDAVTDGEAGVGSDDAVVGAGDGVPPLFSYGSNLAIASAPGIHWCPLTPCRRCLCASVAVGSLLKILRRGQGRGSGGSLALLIGGSGTGTPAKVEFFTGSFFLCCKKRIRLGCFLRDGLVVGLDGPNF